LEELLSDPIVRLLLERDGIDPAALRSHLRSLRARLQPARAAARSGRRPLPDHSARAFAISSPNRNHLVERSCHAARLRARRERGR
jgi:hypothetical protein